MLVIENAVIDELVDAFAAHGIIVDPADITESSKPKRIRADGDGPKVKDAWFTLHLDGRPAGSFGHHSKYPGETFKFRFNGEIAPETADQRRARLEKRERDKEAKEAEQRRRAVRTAENARRSLTAATLYSREEHARLNGYFDRKGIVDARGVMFGAFNTFNPATGKPTTIEDVMLVPMADIDGNLRSMQAIFNDADNVLGRDRTYLPGTQKTGLFFSIGDIQQADGADVIIVCEGAATGLQIWHATHHAVRVAFDAGNLEPVAQALRGAYLDATIIIASDNDQWKTPGRNPGLEAANAAAAAVGGVVAYPPFDASLGKVDASGKCRGPTDFDDLVRADGAGAVREIFEAVLRQVRSAKREAQETIDRARAAALPVFEANDLPATELPSVSLQKHCYALHAFSKPPEAGKDSHVTTLERELRKARGYEPSEPGQEGMHHSAASYAWTLIKRRVRYLPADIDPDDLIANIRCAGAPIHEKTLSSMVGWLEYMCSVRRGVALLRADISVGAKARHIYTPCTELPVFADEDWTGVILIRAPMGSGKTQRVGAGFAKFAKHSETVSGDARFVAIVHRVTLVSELVKRLELTHYRDGRHPITKENAVDVTALGVCLPSINKASLRAIMQNCKYLLVDEIAQVLTFLESKACFEDEGESSRQGVYAALQELVRNVTCVVGMDAGVNDRVIEFIEECRPNEQFRIYDMAQKNEGLSVKYGFGSKTVDMFYEEANRRLDAGEKLWIGCDSRKQANELYEALTKIHGDKRFILITRDTTDRNEQRTFLARADEVSRGYDCVIHSPSISSGLSIEHKRKDAAGNVLRDENGNDMVDLHFDHGMFLGGGCSISAADALQMMRRCRYIKTWTVAIHQNSTEPGPTDARDIIAAKEKGVAAEWKHEKAEQIAWYFAGIEADRNGAKIEFANELLWLMEDAQFTIVRTHQTEDRFDPAARKEARLTIEMREKSMILAARDLNNEEAERLERSSDKTDEDNAALKRHEIAGLFGADVFKIAAENVVDAPLWDAYKDGRGLRRIDGFSAAVHGLADTSEGAKAIEDMHFDVARRQFHAFLWGDTVIKPGNQIDRAAAAGIVERAIANRVTFAYHGIIPKRFAVGKSYKAKANPLDEVAAMLKLIGLDVVEVGSTNKKSGPSAIEIEQTSFCFMEEWSARRRAMQSGVRYVAPAAPAPLPTLAERIQSLQAQGARGVTPCVVDSGALFNLINATLPRGEQVTRNAIAAALTALGMVHFSKAMKWGKKVISVWVDADLAGATNEAVRGALDEVGTCDSVAVLFKRTMAFSEVPTSLRTRAQQGGEARTGVPATLDAEMAENDGGGAENLTLPDDINHLLAIACREDRESLECAVAW
ncbi:toprim domain-containing protein [Paraburkholderia sp. UYCP14C]|uniref:plasmid replication protein, CyRepA1 family n=1 Tax=Paraburkholderia sp. UYCP14C TaxID=2511130 RepID=UPI001021961B|nr:plasmid replication protein, CyRepA1 family [Paraburkholderia sp. UYCP14C]RZF23770.1 toprim domain-containing protein [Paraburkholderia sp. UYCP14C]